MEEVQQLQAIFPHRLPQDLAVILCLHGNDVNRAAEAILADEERNIAKREKRPQRATKNNKWNLSSLWRQGQRQESERRAMAVREETDLQRAIAASLASSTLQTKTSREAPTRATPTPREVQPRPSALPPTRPVATNKLAVATHNCLKSLGENLAKELTPPPAHQHNQARQPTQAAPAGKRSSQPNTNSRQTRPQGPAKDFAAFVNLFNPQNLLLLEAPPSEQTKKKEQQPHKVKPLHQDHSQEELERLKQETNDACRKAISDHLESFLEDDSTGSSYEDWVAELHPENAFLEGSNKVIIDQRFYLEDCWHWQLWKKHSEEESTRQCVPASRCQSQGNPESSSCFVVEAPRSVARSIGSMYHPTRLCRNLTT